MPAADTQDGDEVPWQFGQYTRQDLDFAQRACARDAGQDAHSRPDACSTNA